MADNPGCIILLNGASSAGKSTLAREVRKQIGEPFLRFSLDLFLFDSDVLPDRSVEWRSLRPRVVAGYYGCLAALAAAGNSVIAEIVLEDADQLEQMVSALHSHDLFFVGVRCPLELLKKREEARGDRRAGDSELDFQVVHTFSAYDFEVDGDRPVEESASRLIQAWRLRQRPHIFDRLANP